jgi:hypothetical protein
VVGRIFKVLVGGRTPWMWTLIFPHHEGRSPTHGYEAMREAAMAALGPASAGSLFLPIPVHDPRTLAQRDLRLWPSSDGRPVGCDRRFEIIDASDVLDDVVTGAIPNIHAKREVGLRLHGASPDSKGCREDATTRKNRTRTQYAPFLGLRRHRPSPRRFRLPIPPRSWRRLT